MIMIAPSNHILLSRRDMLRRAGLGFGSWALLDLLPREGRLSAASENPLAAKPTHAPARAKHVIFLFMQGGPSHTEPFDPKPLLNKLHGQPPPQRVIAGRQLQCTKTDAAILGSPQTFQMR